MFEKNSFKMIICHVFIQQMFSPNIHNSDHCDLPRDCCLKASAGATATAYGPRLMLPPAANSLACTRQPGVAPVASMMVALPLTTLGMVTLRL